MRSNFAKANIVKKLLSCKDVSVFWYDNVDSTNSEAKRLVKNTNSDVLVVSDCQTSGYGRKGNKFYSPLGTGAYFSLLYPRRKYMDEGSFISIAVAVAVVESISCMTSINIGIKWPNDILCNNKKVGGILIESFSDNGEEFAVVGIGINIKTKKFPQYAGNATSLDCDVNIIELISNIVNRIHKYFYDMNRTQILNLYNKYFALKDKYVCFKFEGNMVIGKVVGISSVGELALDIDGITRYYNSIDGIKIL